MFTTINDSKNFKPVPQLQENIRVACVCLRQKIDTFNKSSIYKFIMLIYDVYRLMYRGQQLNRKGK